MIVIKIIICEKKKRISSKFFIFLGRKSNLEEYAPNKFHAISKKKKKE